MPTLEHVNLGIPIDGSEAETAFLVDVLGFHGVEAPAEIRARFSPLWFEGDDGRQIHLSVDPEHRPAARAHVAVWLGEELSATEERLSRSGFEWKALDSAVRRVVFTRDPAGNRWELTGPAVNASE
jgi:catechol 2,3-dioxygenase-like lactoylglutathione lyase family enzyme